MGTRSRVVNEEIGVKGQPAQKLELKFTRHGPIFHVDAARHRAYALRSALQEPGTAPYLAGLRLASAGNCREFWTRRCAMRTVRESDLRRRRREHRVAGVGPHAASQRLDGTPSRPRHRNV